MLPTARAGEAVGCALEASPVDLLHARVGADEHPFERSPLIERTLREELRVDPLLEGLLPRAVEVARLAVREVEAGRIFSAEQALPVYLRDDVTHVPPRAS